MLREHGAKVGAIHFTELWPLPLYAFSAEKKYHIVESNATGQLGWLLRSAYGLKVNSTIARYDGLPLDHEYIMEVFV